LLEAKKVEGGQWLQPEVVMNDFSCWQEMTEVPPNCPFHPNCLQTALLVAAPLLAVALLGMLQIMTSRATARSSAAAAAQVVGRLTTISHHPGDEDWVLGSLIPGLEHVGLVCWAAPRDLLPGTLSLPAVCARFVTLADEIFRCILTSS
jgi:hypothetical protein